MVAEIANKYLTVFSNLYAQLEPWARRLPRNSKVYIAIHNFGQNVNAFKRELDAAGQQPQQQQVVDAVVKYQKRIKASQIEYLIAIANELDQSGHYELADRMDQVIEQSRENVCLVDDLIDMADELDGKQELRLADTVDRCVSLVRVASDFNDPEIFPVEPRHIGALSSRYCPDHRGVQAIRVAENQYQCPLDGKVYHYEAGYKNYRGQIVPGGSIARQTPETSSYGIPVRFYDSRQTVVRHLN